MRQLRVNPNVPPPLVARVLKGLCEAIRQIVKLRPTDIFDVLHTDLAKL